MSMDGEKIENIIGHHVEKGGLLGFAWVYGSKVFAIGEPVEFSEEEIMNICMTAHFHVETMNADLHKLSEEIIGNSTASRSGCPMR